MLLNCGENTALDFEAEIAYLEGLEKMKPNYLFVYGILKRGYELDLAHFGAKFIGEAHINGATLYGIGRKVNHEAHPNDGQEFHGVGLRLDDPNIPNCDKPLLSEHVAYGELWEIPDHLWKWLDEIEQNGYCYTRKIVPLAVAGCGRLTVDAWVYEHTFPGFRYENPIRGGKF